MDFKIAQWGERFECADSTIIFGASVDCAI